MRILALYDTSSGVEYHRIIKPLQRLQVDYYGEIEVFTGSRFQENGVPPLDRYDLILFNRHLGPLHDKIMEYMAQKNIPYIIDIDDWWKIPRHHPGWDYYKKNDLFKKIPEAIRYANAVTCTNEQLAAHIRQINPKVRILPNALDTTDEQWNQPKVKSDKFRFLYAPGITHYNDILMIAPAVSDICREYGDRVEFIYAGYNVKKDGSKIPAVESMLNRFNNNEKNRKPQIKVIQAQPPNKYGAFFAHADCVLAPLENTSYNQCKSDLKIQEAAAYRLPILVSECLPYTEQLDNDGVTFVKGNDWFGCMKAKLDYRNTSVGKWNEQYNERFRNIETINSKRLDTFKWALQSHTTARG